MRVATMQNLVFLVGLVSSLIPATRVGGHFVEPALIPPIITAQAAADDSIDLKSDQDSNRTGYRVRVPLPINASASTKVRQTLRRLAEKSKAVVRPEDRPVVVLEFDTASGATGAGSEMEACLSLARFLGDAELNGIYTVAYIPAARPTFDLDTAPLESSLKGHAVLVAIAANQLAMAPGTSIGQAGIDEKNLQDLVKAIYKGVAQQRLATLPVPVVMSMLVPELELYRVVTNDGRVVFVGAEEFQKLAQSGAAEETDTICGAGELANLTRQQLEDFRLLRLRPTSRTDLARLLDLAPNALQGNPATDRDWVAVELTLPPVVDEQTVRWMIRALNQQANTDVNLVIIRIDSNTSNADACIQLCQHLVQYDPDEVRTVAVVENAATGFTGLVALSCSNLIMKSEAILGGSNDEKPIENSKLEIYQPLIQSIAKQKQTDWSLMMQMIDPTLSVSRYRHRDSGQVRLLCTEELNSINDVERWDPLGPIGGASGIDANNAQRNYLASAIINDSDEIQKLYQLETAPRILEPSATDRWLEKFAAFLTSPLVAPWLLFAAMIFFSTELSAPGLGVPGFMSVVCFVLFFWSQSLDGNAEWFEIILFFVGVAFLAIEIFVLPGFGIFGFGGILMVAASLVLAAQSSPLIPRTNEQLAQLPYSMLPILGAGLGIVVGLVAVRKALPHSPYLRRLMLEPPKREETGLGDTSDPESVVDWSHLLGQTGLTLTKLHPSGKARIGGKVYDVISNGPLLEKKQKIIVIEAKGNRVVVKQQVDR